jgi:RNA polymerase sigma-70 factor, ECF subfamily
MEVDDPDRTAVFERHRGRLFGIAYRMLGSVTDAEDVLQDAWLKWNRADGQVARPAAYLARTVTNLSLDRLSSAAVQRERRGCPSRWSPAPPRTWPTRWSGPNRCRWPCWWCWRA